VSAVLILAKPMSTECFSNYRPLIGQIFFGVRSSLSTSAFGSFMTLFTSALNLYPWLDRAYKYLKEFATIHVCPLSESDQCLYDTAFHRFRELMGDFQSLHRLKYAQYIVRIESGLKNNPRGFFMYADMKRNASGYPSSMFLGSNCAWDSHNIADLFAGFFQCVYVQEDWIPDSDGHKMPSIEVSEDEVECAFLSLDVNKGPGPDGITPAILKRLASVVKVLLTFVFNLSLSAGVFDWKESIIYCYSFIQERR
jgi:hypothetical protein